jgi:hypothetical protein
LIFSSVISIEKPKQETIVSSFDHTITG